MNCIVFSNKWCFSQTQQTQIHLKLSQLLFTTSLRPSVFYDGFIHGHTPVLLSVLTHGEAGTGDCIRM